MRTQRISLRFRSCVSPPIALICLIFVFLTHQQAIPMCNVSFVSKSLSFPKIDLECGRLLIWELQLLFRCSQFLEPLFFLTGRSLDSRHGAVLKFLTFHASRGSVLILRERDRDLKQLLGVVNNTLFVHNEYDAQFNSFWASPS